MGTPLRVVLVDADAGFCGWFSDCLAKDGRFALVGTAASAAQARRLITETPHILLTELHVPGGGLALIRHWLNEAVLPAVVALTRSEAIDDLASALRGGARGYLLKATPEEELLDSLRRVARGEIVVAPAMTGKLIELVELSAATRPRRRPHGLSRSGSM